MQAHNIKHGDDFKEDTIIKFGLNSLWNDYSWGNNKKNPVPVLYSLSYINFMREAGGHKCLKKHFVLTTE